MRVAYVAATRARDVLVVPVVGDVEWDGWVGPLNGAVYPPAEARRSAAPAPSCPPFKKDSVFRRPDNDPFTSATVQPGLHVFGAGAGNDYSVVWWGPHALTLGAEQSLGLRRESLIMKDVPSAVVEQGLRDYHRWSARRDQALRDGRLATVSMRTATEWASNPDMRDLHASGDTVLTTAHAVQGGLFDEPARPSPPDEDPARHVSMVDLRGRRRPGGARYGELVHAILAAVPLDAAPDVVGATAAVQARILGAPDAEQIAASEAVRSVLEHELLRQAAAAQARGALRRECPVTLTAPTGVLLEGVVDLAFAHGGGWVVVDFKTDREISEQGEERYRRQVAVYCAAIAKATGEAVVGTILRI